MAAASVMSCDDVMHELERLGTAQNRKVYARHGVGEAMFGVSFADLDKLQRKIKQHHALALELWATGNHDARILATKVADPQAMKRKDLESWAKDLDCYVIADACSNVGAASPHGRELADKWIASKNEWIGQAGWNIVSRLATTEENGPEDEYFLSLLTTIEKRIHSCQNRVRYAMNGAMIAIGGRNQRLRKAALAAAGKVGRVEVDHGETGCKTPDAAAYIERIWARKK